MDRPVVLAICGKSATGKTSLAAWLKKELTLRKVPVNLIISDTTRPPRKGEENGVDYNFVPFGKFIQQRNNNLYLESSCFRNWRYGTHVNSIKNDKINIGIFNAEGIRSLQSKISEYNIIPIYLEENCFERLRRSYQREHQWKFEYIRRLFVDWIDFFNFEKELRCFCHWLRFTNDSSVISKSKRVCFYLETVGIIGSGQKNII